MVSAEYRRSGERHDADDGGALEHADRLIAGRRNDGAHGLVQNDAADRPRARVMPSAARRIPLAARRPSRRPARTISAM